MSIHLIQVPYDSGHRAKRMGRGPLRLVDAGAPDRLGRIAPVRMRAIEASSSFPTEIGSAFELHRALSGAVAEARGEGALPIVLSGNCNSAIGTVAGLHRAMPEERLGVVWFDGHGDCNTPETFTGTFLDAMGLSTLSGRCWQALAATVPGFRPVPDERVLLVGAHGADRGALGVLAASRMGHAPTAVIHARGPGPALAPALGRLARHGVTRLYLHLDVDVLDAAHAAANQFAPKGGLLPEQLARCVEAVTARFGVAGTAVASYDPAFDDRGRVLDAALRFMESVAAAARRPLA